MIIQSQSKHQLRTVTCMLMAALLVFFMSPAAMVYAEDVPPPTTDPTTTTTTTDPSATTTTPTTTDTTLPPTTTTSDPPTTTTQPATTVDPATTTTSPTTTSSTDTSTLQGPTSPTGADASTYTFNPTTGLWENGTYTWNPVTKQTAPMVAPTYSYNPDTGHWDTTQWIYDAPSGKYIPNVVSVTTPPAGATLLNTSAAPGTGPASNNSSVAPQSFSSPTGSSPTADPTSSSTSSGFFNQFYNAAISNTLSSLAKTGDALVNMNTLAGNALSGSASAMATIINLLQSSWGSLASNMASFTQNIFGNLFGDLTLNPGTPSPATSATLPDNLTVNSDQNALINNKITLDATSGNAGVTNNTTAGNATSGDATAILNLVNAINSSIAAGQSFLGMLNIFGSLNGDILLPQNFIDSLLAANTVGTLDTSQINDSSVLGNFTNNQAINNDVTLGATSGNATVSDNTKAGSATTGDASTNLTVLNLTGRQIVGSNALLVFVNVLGKWVGVIVDAPTGTTSAALGGGITGNTSLTSNATSNQTINNEVSVNAASGDATVAKNTSAGNATTGDAHAAANILNLNGSQLSLSNWFGILFINVFGTWNGSFGVDTSAGELMAPLASAMGSTTTGSAPTVPVSDVKAFRFTPAADGSYSLEKVSNPVAVLSANDNATPTPPANQTAKATPESTSLLAPKAGPDWLLTASGVIIATSLLGTERYLSRRNMRFGRPA